MIVVQARVVDPTHLELAEPISAKPGERVTVSVIQGDVENDERAAWLSLSAECLREAYGETEPDYSLDLVRETNPEYE